MVSTISGPIPPHPYYDSQVSDSRASSAGRTRPEGQGYAHKGQSGSIATLLIDGLSIAPQPVRRYTKPEPRDHVKENVRRMRQIQRQTRHRQEESQKPVKALWKSSYYENVSSKVKENLENEGPPTRPQSASNFLRAHSRTGFSPAPSRPSTAQPRSRSPSVPSASSARELNLMRNDIDFIKVNGRSVKSSSMKRSPSLTALDDLKKKKEEEEKSYKKGSVPKYLVQRQKQWQKEAEERRASEPDPEMPPGHRMMSEAERSQTLKKLLQTQRDLTQELAKLPIRSDTVRLRTIKQGLEKKMSEIEEALKIFSRPKVFVKLDT